LLVAFCLPLLTDNFGNIWIIQAGMEGNDILLMVLTIQDERYKTSVYVADEAAHNKGSVSLSVIRGPKRATRPLVSDHRRIHVGTKKN
jgi:hypothetical protein